jgi:hypothetical protein
LNSQNEKSKFSQPTKPCTFTKQQVKQENLDDDDDDDLLKNCDFALLEGKSVKKVEAPPLENIGKISFKRHPSENSSIAFIQKDSNFKKIKTEKNDSDQHKQVRSPLSNSTNQNSSNNNEFKKTNYAPMPIINSQENSSQEDDQLLLSVISNLEPKSTSTQISQPTGAHIRKTPENPEKKFVNTPVSNEKMGNNTHEPFQKKIKELDEIINYKLCCTNKKPVNIMPGEANLSLCIHIITGYVKELTDKLVQSKLKWSQVCLISDMRSNEYQAYLSNDPIELLLNLTCLEAKDIFKKSKELNLPPSENKYGLLFDQKRSNYCEKLTKTKFLMHLKFDFEKEMFCVFKIENIQER